MGEDCAISEYLRKLMKNFWNSIFQVKIDYFIVSRYTGQMFYEIFKQALF